MDLLHSERFIDLAPEEIYATLLDEGVYVCHWSTMYRYLHNHQEVKDRRNQRRHPKFEAPELFADGSNQLWSWDITKLLGPKKWVYYYLYVLLDVFSRYVVQASRPSEGYTSFATHFVLGWRCEGYHRRRSWSWQDIGT
jgi:putative transposase